MQTILTGTLVFVHSLPGGHMVFKLTFYNVMVGNHDINRYENYKLSSFPTEKIIEISVK